MYKSLHKTKKKEGENSEILTGIDSGAGSCLVSSFGIVCCLRRLNGCVNLYQGVLVLND